MKGRIYDPLAGRFTTADPVTQAPYWSQGLNRYSYVFNDPVNNTDPSGFMANGADSTAGIIGWGASVVGLAAAQGFGLGAGFGGLGAGANLGSTALSSLLGGPSLGGGKPGVSYDVPTAGAPSGSGVSSLSPLAKAANTGSIIELAAPHGRSRGIGASPVDDVVRVLGQDIGCLLGECKSLVDTTLAAVRLFSTDELRALASVLNQVHMTASPDISVGEIAGHTPDEIDKIARGKGLIPKGPNPRAGQGAYVDPVTGKQRVLVHPDGPSPHAHVNNPAGQRLGPGNRVVEPEAPEAHLPLR
jgi:hypothetical protein